MSVRNPLGTVKTAIRAGRIRLRKAMADSHQEFYRDHVRRQFEADPRLGVSDEAEQYDDMGEWQFELLKNHGLEPADEMLDVGCGSLRGGRHFVGYLDPGNYVGMDISQPNLRWGRQRVRSDGLLAKRPTLIQNLDLTFSEPEIVGREFDIIFAQSVLTHCDPAQVGEFLENARNVLDPDGRVVVTIFLEMQSSEGYRTNLTGTAYHYSPTWWGNECARHGWRLQRWKYSDHPNGQMVCELRDVLEKAR